MSFSSALLILTPTPPLFDGLMATLRAHNRKGTQGFADMDLINEYFKGK
jgi:hypothetical protein